jgi:hypothetical protein
MHHRAMDALTAAVTALLQATHEGDIPAPRELLLQLQRG